MLVARADPNIRFDAAILLAILRPGVVLKILRTEVLVDLFAAAYGEGVRFVDTHGRLSCEGYENLVLSLR